MPNRRRSAAKSAAAYPESLADDLLRCCIFSETGYGVEQVHKLFGWRPPRAMCGGQYRPRSVRCDTPLVRCPTPRSLRYCPASREGTPSAVNWAATRDAGMVSSIFGNCCMTAVGRQRRVCAHGGSPDAGAWHAAHDIVRQSVNIVCAGKVPQFLLRHRRQVDAVRRSRVNRWQPRGVSDRRQLLVRPRWESNNRAVSGRIRSLDERHFPRRCSACRPARAGQMQAGPAGVGWLRSRPNR